VFGCLTIGIGETVCARANTVRRPHAGLRRVRGQLRAACLLRLTATAEMSPGQNCEELFWQHPIESLLNFAAALFAKGAPGKPLPARRFRVSGTGKASDMKKAVFAVATAATLGVTALMTPSPAQAWRGGWGPGLAGGLIAGAVIGGIASGAYGYGPGYGYYGGPGYGYYGGPGYAYYGGYAPAYYGGGYAPAYYGYRSSYYAPAYYGYYGPRYYPGW
jgi:hypothetical protein